MKYYVVFILLLGTKSSYCQVEENLTVQVKKQQSLQARSSVFEISISNLTDSIVCILHSSFLILSVGNGPQELADPEKKDNKQWYSLKKAVRDTLVTYEVPQYRAAIILPYQAISFKISVPFSSMDQCLLLNYFRVFDICYRKFKERTMIGWWYKEYNISEKSISLPK